MSSGPSATLDDLVNEQNAATAADDDESSDGEWVVQLFDRLEQRGVVDAMLAQQFDMDPETLADDGGDGDADATAGDGMDADGIDATVVSQFGKVVIDEVGDVPMSKVVRFAEQNPQTVNQLIQQVVGGDDGA